MHNDIEKILVTEEEIQEKCRELGKQLAEEYKDRFPLAIGVLKVHYHLCQTFFDIWIRILKWILWMCLVTAVAQIHLEK